MIKAFIFDLDNCIFDTFSLGVTRLKPLWHAVDSLGEAGDIPMNSMPEVRDDLSRLAVLDVVAKHALPKHVATILLDSMQNIRITSPIESYGDHEIIKSLKGKKFLVTGGAGHEEYQHSKITALGIEDYFEEIVMPEAGNKKPVFERLAVAHAFENSECVVLGDNPYSELAAGKQLGMITIQTLRPKIERGEGFDHYIKTFHELPAIIARYE